MMILSIAPLLTQRYLVTYDGFRRRAHLLTQCLFTWSRKIKLFEPSKGIFRDPTKYWTTKTRKRLSICQKWFLRPYFPLIRGVFVFRRGLRFSFQALEMPEPRVRKKLFSLTKIFINHVSKALDQIVSYWQFQATIRLRSNENHFNKTLIIRRIYSCVINVVNSCPPPLALVTSCALD